MAGQAFTSRYRGLSNTLTNQVNVLPHDPDSKRPKDLGRKLTAQWDTGANGTVISRKLVKELGLSPISIVEARGCGGTYNTGLYYIDLFLPNQVAIPRLQVSDGDFEDIDVLIGMDIICRGDFAVSNYNGKTTFSFRMPSFVEIDYVEKSYIDPHRKEYEPGRNDSCPCGSGKKYKNCCLLKIK